MIYQLSNEYLTANIDSKGGLLRSLKDKEGTEYIWQRDEKYWNENDINIFPYIARLTDETYLYEGQAYHLPIHGFLWTSELEVVSIEEQSMEILLKSSPETLRQYPFDFQLKITRSLVENCLYTTFEVQNKSEKTMYFGIGGHPAFNVPLEKDSCFEDYYLQFEEETTLSQVNMNENGFVVGKNKSFNLLNAENQLFLTHQLFDKDAIILESIGSGVQLRSNKGGKGLAFISPDFRYLGIWHMPKTNASYLCLEPWSSLPSRQNVVEEISEQENLIELEPEATYVNTFGIKLI